MKLNMKKISVISFCLLSAAQTHPMEYWNRLSGKTKAATVITGAAAVAVGVYVWTQNQKEKAAKLKQAQELAAFNVAQKKERDRQVRIQRETEERRIEEIENARREKEHKAVMARQQRDHEVQMAALDTQGHNIQGQHEQTMREQAAEHVKALEAVQEEAKLAAEHVRQLDEQARQIREKTARLAQEAQLRDLQKQFAQERKQREMKKQAAQELAEQHRLAANKGEIEAHFARLGIRDAHGIQLRVNLFKTITILEQVKAAGHEMSTDHERLHDRVANLIPVDKNNAFDIEHRFTNSSALLLEAQSYQAHAKQVFEKKMREAERAQAAQRNAERESARAARTQNSGS